MQIELTAHCTIGTDRADNLVRGTQRFGPEALLGNELEDGTGGAHSHTLTAPGASRMIGIAVTAHDDLGMLAAHADIEHPDLLDILARPHTAGTQNTGAHVMLDHDITGTLITGAERQIVVGTNRHVVLHHVPLEFIPRIGPPTIHEVLTRVALQEKVEHTSAALDGGCRLGLHHHAVGSGCSAGGEELVLSLDRDQADPAVADDRELGIPAQGGNFYSGRTRSLEHRGSGLEGDRCTVYRQAWHADRFVEVPHSSLDRKIW
jgi:hypothetical protein